MKNALLGSMIRWLLVVSISLSQATPALATVDCEGEETQSCGEFCCPKELMCGRTSCLDPNKDRCNSLGDCGKPCNTNADCGAAWTCTDDPSIESPICLPALSDDHPPEFICAHQKAAPEKVSSIYLVGVAAFLRFIARDRKRAAESKKRSRGTKVPRES